MAALISMVVTVLAMPLSYDGDGHEVKFEGLPGMEAKPTTNGDRPMTEEQLIELALRQPIAAEQFRPIDLHLDRNEGLRVKWADGHVSQYPLAYIRKRCPCASCRTEREAQQHAPGRSLSLTILPSNIDRATQFADAKLVGNYAIQIAWADGHTTGIYDFRYLRIICPANKSDDGISQNPRRD